MSGAPSTEAALREKVEALIVERERAERYDDLDDRIGARHFVTEHERNLGRWVVDNFGALHERPSDAALVEAQGECTCNVDNGYPCDVHGGLLLDGTPPIALRVVEMTPEGHATALFGIVADHGWAERILFSNAYERDARAICAILDAALAARPDAEPKP